MSQSFNKSALREVFIRVTALQGIAAGKSAALGLIDEALASRKQAARKAYYASTNLRIVLAGATISLLGIFALGSWNGLILDMALKFWLLAFSIIGVFSYTSGSRVSDFNLRDLRDIVNYWATPFDSSYSHEKFLQALKEHPDFRADVGAEGITRAHYSLFDEFLDEYHIAKAASEATARAEVIRQELLRRNQSPT